LEKTLNELISEVRSLCHEVDADIVLAGILPTIHAWDLRLENMAPKPRYYSLNDTIMGLKGGLAQYHIRGVDELFFQHDNIMVEGCNTSFQVHFQVTPENFAHFYNIAQLVSEVFQEDIARFRVIMTSDYEDPFNALEKGEVPKLRALQLHNGTVYRWNRACYGISGSQPHLRIENRYLPAGPTVVDEVANSAFWAGLMHGIALKTDDIRPLMDFDDAKSNFIGTARRGLASEVDWIDGKRWRARDLIQNELVDIAAEGLRSRQVNEDDIQRYMGIIRDRVANSQTGAQWQLSSLAAMKRKGGTSRAERLDHLVECMQKRQLDGEPGHTWPLADIEPRAVNTIYGTRVEHFMSTDLFTVREDELVDFVAVLMSWQHIRHVLVEDIEHRLVGLVTHRSILKSLTNFNGVQEDEDIPVSQIMVRDPISVSPEMATIDAVRVMRENNIGALPVVLNGQLVGIITETDFNQLAARLFEDKAKAIQPDSE
jgi:CBS domain-containing protein